MDMHSNSIWVTDVLHLLQKVIKCQQLPLEKLAENLKKSADLYDSEPLRTCLDAHHEVLSCIVDFLNEMNAENKFKKFFASKRNKSTLQNLFIRFEMTSNGLQTGIMIDRADMYRLSKNVDRASDSVPVKTDSSDSILLKKVNQIDSKINAYKQSVHQSKCRFIILILFCP
ncbi:hypothetical protein BC833DRAFT_607895 [Globomyces pollinis-pini]|nr:hypothetical protein BC833DRAFT_607895 [Globomyces pollinis-pini]